MAYMHLRDRAHVHKGDRVATGQPIGFVGRTGDATACHLHFELWTPSGWYTGGHPVDPLPSLQRWDAQGPPVMAPAPAAPVAAVAPAAGGTAAPTAPNPKG
jgi:murein DD-endopeptidase MepM/ murein hydrolase activator NlpD